MSRARHVNHTASKGHVGAIVGTMILIAAALCIFLYRDKLTPDAAAKESAAPSAGDAFTYEAGSRQMFALMGSELAVASTTGSQILDEDGGSTLREVFSMTEPAVCTNGSVCVFYDIGGTALRVVKDGKSTVLDRKTPITSAAISSGGYLAVTGEEDGYKGSVTVYNSEQKPVYQWYSGSGYPLDAAVSPGGDTLAVLTVGAAGSEVHLFRLDSEKETASVKLDGELALRLHFARSGDFCVLSQKALRFYTPGGKALSTYSFENSTLEDYEFGADLTVVALGKYVSGGSTDLVSLGEDGKKLGSVTLPEAPAALSSQGRKLLVLTSDSVTVYDSAMRAQKSAAISTGYLSAALLPDGDALLLSTHYAEKCTPQSS